MQRALRTLVVTVVALGVVSSLATAAQATSDGGAAAYQGGDSGSGLPAMRVVHRDDAQLLTRAVSSVSFSDLDSTDAWARNAIGYVAGSHLWMRDFAANPDGTYPFHPDAIETRKYLARAVVLAFAPDELPDPTIVFADVDPASSWYRYAAVATKHGWLSRRADGAFMPDKPVTMAAVHRALVFALGLKDAAKSLGAIHTRADQTFHVPHNFGTTVLGMRLFLRYNAPTGQESNDVAPTDALSRSQVAYSLWMATNQSSSYLAAIATLHTQYDTVELPYLGPKQLALVQWGIRYGGYPYVWGGEWGLDSPEPSALGGQPRSGFDCSGFAWWLLRANDDVAWRVAPPRPYAGWSLAQRTSAEMARMAPKHLTYDQLKPGDLMFYDGDEDGTVDHVDTYIGNGYALDSSSTPGGVTIMWVADGWYFEHFKWGRRIFS